MTPADLVSFALPLRQTPELLIFNSMDDRARQHGHRMWARNSFTEFAFAPIGAIRPELTFLNREAAGGFLDALT